MDRSSKAALLSALVFPGVGQWYLGRRLRALLFAAPALGGAWVFLSHAWVLAMSISEEIAAGRVGFDPFDIAERIHQQAAASTGATDIAAAVMIVCWAGAALDAWLLGRKPA